MTTKDFSSGEKHTSTKSHDLLINSEILCSVETCKREVDRGKEEKKDEKKEEKEKKEDKNEKKKKKKKKKKQHEEKRKWKRRI